VTLSPKVKSGLVLLGTLLLGMVLGAVVTGAVIRYRVDRLAALRDEQGFVRTLEEVIDPRDSAQQAEIRRVLRAAAERNRAILFEMRSEIRASTRQMRRELAPILTEEQVERLERLRERGRSLLRRGGPGSRRGGAR